MRIFKDLKLVEQLGTGIIRILKSYDKDVYEISDNFIRVNFEYKTNCLSYKIVMDKSKNDKHLSETQKSIIKLIEYNNKITQLEMVKILGINKSTVTRNLKVLKQNNLIKRIGSDKNGYWKII